MTKKNSHGGKGFTLIEMTVVIVIASIIIAAGLALVRPYFAQQQIERTASAVRTVEHALDNFLAENGRYPCPAPLRTPRNSVNDGVELCTADAALGIFTADGQAFQGSVPATTVPDGVIIGAVPYRTLDIPVAATLDAASNRLTYVVSAASTNITSFDDELGTGTTPLESSAAVYIVNESGASISQRDIDGLPGDESLSKHYYFFSHGSDGAGSYTNDGLANAKACGGTLDSENCNMDGVFVAAARNLGAAASYNDDVSNESLLIEEDISDSLWARNPSNEDHIYNLNDENVGIGTGPSSQPAAKLHVKGTGGAAAPIFERSNKKIWFDPNSNDSNVWAQIAIDEGMGFQFEKKVTSGWANLMSITNAGNVGIGTENPLGILHAIMPTNQPVIAEWFGSIGGPNTGSHLRIMSNRGTEASPSQVRTNDALGILSFGSRGDDSGLNGHSASIVAVAAQNFTGTARGADLVFKTTALGQNGIPNERMRISSEGNVGIGITNPDRPLEEGRNVNIRSVTGMPNWWTSLTLFHNSDSGHHPGITGHRGRGTYESPTGALSGNIIMSYDGRGDPRVVGPTPDPWFGTGIMILATQDHSSGNAGSELLFRTTLNGTLSGVVRGKITNDGNFKIGAGNPAAKLDVDGGIKIKHDGALPLPMTCTAAQEGSQRYNPTAGKKYMEFCNGTAWLPVGGTGGNLEFYDCYTSTGIHVDDGWKCPAPNEMVKDVWSNGGDWGSGGDAVQCCKARMVP